MTAKITFDSQVFTYLVEANSGGYDPKADPDPDLARERVAAFRVFLYHYEYALPRHLQTGPADLVYALAHGSMELFARMHILVVHSGRFPEVIGDIANAADHFLR